MSPLTEKEIAERRASISREVAAQVSGAVTPEAACMLAAEGLSAFRDQIPFALFYLTDQGIRYGLLAGISGMEPGGLDSPFVIPLTRADTRWPVGDVVRNGAPHALEDAVAVPIRSREGDKVFGCAVLGLAGVPLDDQHRCFLQTLAENVGTAIEHAQSNGSGSIADEAAEAAVRSIVEEAEKPRSVVLLVEDNRADVFLVERAIEYHHLPVQVVVAQDGEEAVQYIERAASEPDVVCPSAMLVDLNLPKRSGIEVLERVRQSESCHGVPVIIVTSSDSRNDRERTTELGATRYFRKPSSYQEFLQLGQVLREVLQESAG